jgi:uncharacterized protein YbjT (DUF2867 family)
MILVTSANGNQGRRLVPKLLAAGHQVRACVQSKASADHLGTWGVHEVLVGDLADSDFIARAVHGVRSVYHVGPTTHPAERAMSHFVFSSVLEGAWAKH